MVAAAASAAPPAAPAVTSNASRLLRIAGCTVSAAGERGGSQVLHAFATDPYVLKWVSAAALRRAARCFAVAAVFAQLAAGKALASTSCGVRQQFVAHRYASAHVKVARRISATGASVRRETHSACTTTPPLATPAAAHHRTHARNRTARHRAFGTSSKPPHTRT